MPTLTLGGPRASAAASQIFESRHHPGDRSPTFVFGMALSGPLAFALIILMIAGTASVLMRVDPLPWLTFAVPAAIAIAIAFTTHTLRSNVAELLIYGDRAAVRTVWDVAVGRAAVPQTFLPPRRVQEGLDVGIGVDLITLTPEEWPQLNAIAESLLTIAPPTRPSPI